MMKVEKIVGGWLKEHGYDGLCNCDRGCGCLLDNFAPCGEISPCCEAGRRKDVGPEVECGCDREGKAHWHVVTGVKKPHKATDIATMRGADWDGVEKEVVEKLRMLKALCAHLEPNPLNDKIAEDLFLPALRLLGEFCVKVQIEEVGNGKKKRGKASEQS